MQDQQVKKGNFIFFAMPVEAMEESGISEGDLLQISAAKGAILIEAVTDKKDIVCSGDCENCPINETDCDGDCEKCPCYNKCE